MIIKFLSKISFSIVSILGTIFTSDTISTKSPKSNTLQGEISTIKTLDDIEILEKKKGCSFSFIDSWGQNKSYRANQFFKNLSEETKKKEKWETVMPDAGNTFSTRCKNGAVIPLAFNDVYKKFYIKDLKNP